ncbi:MAG TPA: galactose-1-phosphate uridylyltransferase [Polyangiaceae bacterium]|nr:galactose-1-phosphate uridylyltransferase [Polyangiaceae bacterium]
MVWEERWHPLRREWVTVAAHRQNRPWSGNTVGESARRPPAYDPSCFLCPGNARVSGRRNPVYSNVFVFDNDHPCVGPDAPLVLPAPAGIYRVQPATGLARVVCYSPRHDLTLAELELVEVEALLREWQQQYRELGARPEVKNVLIFENKGEVVGVSNPHPHCQIYATNFVFRTIEVEIEASRAHFEQTGRLLFQDILSAEREDGRRLLAENATAIAFVPYFARYAYEVYVAPKRAVQSIADLDLRELSDLARVLLDVVVAFDNLWKLSFPYVMTLHQAPTDGGDYPTFQFHIVFQPPLRKPNLLKYLAGPEIGGGCFLSDTCPEEKAQDLRNALGPHYGAAG